MTFEACDVFEKPGLEVGRSDFLSRDEPYFGICTTIGKDVWVTSSGLRRRVFIKCGWRRNEALDDVGSVGIHMVGTNQFLIRSRETMAASHEPTPVQFPLKA